MAVSCYLRHMKDVLDEAGIEVTPANRKQVDQAVHKAVGVTYKDCPTTWQRVKQDIRGDESKRRALIEQIKSAL
jgi:molecular chaperone GrpE (heat shock protein)